MSSTGFYELPETKTPAGQLSDLEERVKFLENFLA